MRRHIFSNLVNDRDSYLTFLLIRIIKFKDGFVRFTDSEFENSILYMLIDVIS